MKRILIAFILLIALIILVLNWINLFGEKEVNKIYVLEIVYEGGNIYLKDIYVKEGYPRNFQEIKDGYRCVVYSKENKILHSFTFLISNLWHYDYIDEETGEIKGGVLEVDREELALTIPYFENGNRINIYNKDGRLILSVDISRFAKSEETNFIIYLLFFVVIVSILILIVVMQIKRNENIQ